MKNKTTKTNPKKKEGRTGKKIKKMASANFLSKALIGVLVLAGLYYFRGQFIVATVNGKPITRIALIRELELQSGKTALDNIIINSLVLQEGRKKGVSVNDLAVQGEIETISQNLSSQGQDLDAALAAQGMTRKDLEKQILIQKTAEEIVKNDVEVTDEEISQYIEDNKDYIPSDMSEEDARNSAKEQLLQQKINTAIQDLVSRLQKDAKINNLLFGN